MHYYWLILPALALAGIGCAVCRNGLAVRSEAVARRIVLAFTGLVFCVYFLLGWGKYGAFQFGLWDLGIYDSLLRMTAAGEGIMHDFRGGLYDHFSPLVLVLVPFYWLCDTPMHLVWFQSAALAAGVPVLYCLAKKYLRSPGAALALALLYALDPYYSRLALYDFHFECLFPAVFLGGFLARAYGKPRLAMALWMTCLLIKEDFVVPVFALGFFFLFDRYERKNGVILMAWSVFVTFFVLKVYFPCLSETGYWHYGRYELLAPTLEGTVKNALVLADRVFRFDSLAVLLSVILPFALLPLGHWRMFVFVLLPTLGIQLASSSGHQHYLMSHYGSALIGVAPLAALWGLRAVRVRLARRRAAFAVVLKIVFLSALRGILRVFGEPPTWELQVMPSRLAQQRFLRRLALFALIFGGVYHVACCDLPLTRYYSYIPKWEAKYHFGILSLPLRPFYYQGMLEQEIRGEELRRVFPLIPPGSRVAVQNELGVPLLRTHKVYSLPGPYDADYVLFDRELYTGYDYITMLNDCIVKRIRDPKYVLICRENGILLFARRDLVEKKR